MFAIVSRFDLVDQAAASAFDTLVTATVNSVLRTEHAVVMHVTSTVMGAPLSRVLCEVFRDWDAFDEHAHYPHTRHFVSQRAQYVIAVRSQFYYPHGPHRLVGA